ncbi:hypothetical protein CORC01_10844 [Colletotrichum orchidophilum]|uniref:Uncharacterized protein n=1 Tax=Colletotrichum orchidophilum TaxID=1209926 RepID=A0A1G4AXL0_9PEZI|nr:uncharacterized protein CORC01_10844 [Colletotrichum orchidophilum]OHE93823.1 hypothetical protein CORC01_10844 [Colletotrichum orchidophilum]
MKTSATLLALVAAGNASPLGISVKRDALDSKDAMCKGWDLTTPEGADKLWEDTYSGASLDLFIKTQWEHENSWVKNLEDFVSGGTSGKSGAAGCSALGNECKPLNDMTCDAQYDAYGKTPIGKNSYWIFQAVKGMHAKFNELNRQLTKETLISGLQIGQMVTDFQGNQDDPGDVLSWLSAAASMGGAIGGLVPGAGTAIAGGFGMLSGIFSGLAASNSANEIDQGSISAALADAFKQATGALENTLRIATGGGTSQAEYDSLPAPKWDTFQSKITKFYNGGWFLVDDDEQAVTVALQSISNNIKPKVANDVMSAAKLYLVADKRDNVKSREDCGYATGRQWMALRDGEEYCFYIMLNSPNPNRENDWVEVEAEVYDKMASYGLGNRDPYYRAIIDCALNGGDDKDKVDLSNLAWGKVPTCYFNLPAVFIEKDTNVGCGSPFDNQGCNYLKATPIS